MASIMPISRHVKLPTVWFLKSLLNVSKMSIGNSCWGPRGVHILRGAPLLSKNDSYLRLGPN